MKPAGFDYHRPATVEEATSLLAELGDEAKVLAGGQSLIPVLALRLAVFDHLVDIGRTAGVSGFEQDGDGSVWIGAGTTQATIERSAEVAAAIPLLARATPLIGHFQIRNRGTIGGSLAHADASAEYPAVALTLDAELHAASATGERRIPAADFFTGPFTTALGADELLTGVTFPVWRGRTGFAVEEFARRHGDFAVAGAAVAVEVGTDDRIRRCGIGLFGLGSTPQRALAVEANLIGRSVTDAQPDDIGQSAMSGLESVPSDLHGPADYRTRVGAAMVARGWQRALQEALHG
jgi:carbon-monoxide dehydrogenase medium subunit